MKNILIALALFAAPASAADLSTLAAAAVQGPLVALIDTFKQQTGHTVDVDFDTVPNIVKRLGAGETADVLIATSAGIDQAIKDGKAIAETRMTVGRIGLGVSVSRGRSADVSTPDAVKAAVLQADTVLISQGTSGVYVRKMLTDMGIIDQIKSKIVEVPSGVALMERLGTAGRNEIGFTAVSEAKRGSAAGGGNFVGLLPAAIQNFTEYQAVVTSASKEGDTARAFLRTIGSPQAKRLLAENGWDVQAVRALDAGSR